MANVTVFGAAYSVYVRSVRLALEEKQVKYRLAEVDVFAAAGAPPEHLVRQPFGRIPAFEHGDFSLYETSAIVRYIDEVFPGPPLQPSDAHARARMNQVISILDSYAYRTLVWDLFVERVAAPARGRSSNEATISAALPRAETCLRALADLAVGQEWLAGAELTLADLHAAPMFACFTQTPEADRLMATHERLRRWWARMSTRESMKRTGPANTRSTKEPR